MRASSVGWCSVVVGVLVASGASVASAQICAPVAENATLAAYMAACPMGSNIIVDPNLDAPNLMLVGTAGDDCIIGLGGTDIITGLGGNDCIYGGAGVDSIDGGDDNDTIYGGAAGDILVGGAGVDYIDGGTGADTIAGGDGNDTLLGGAGNGADTINGDDGDDNITGGGGADILSGGLGADTINGEGGVDTVLGGDGNDTLRGSGGTDLIFGGDGDDRIFGGNGNDTLHGDAGLDELFGNAGQDNLFGGADQDDLDGGPEDDYCNSGNQLNLPNNTTVGTGVTAAPAPDGDTFTGCEALITYAALGVVDGVTVGGRPALRFVTNGEAGTQGFEVSRRVGERFVPVGPALVPALMGAPQGGTYFVADSGLRNGATYRIVEVEVDGTRNDLGEHTVALAGSVSVTLQGGVAAVEHAPMTTPVASVKAGDEPDGPPVALYLGVGESGIYRVTMTQVAAALELSLSAAQAHLASHGLSLSVEGQPVAWWTDPDSDALYFYGESRDSMYLADNLYRLSVGSGATVTTRDAAAASGGEGALSEHVVRAEVDVAAVTAMNPDAQEDFWFWQYVGPGRSADFPITLASPTGAGLVELSIELHGAATRAVTGEHSAIVRVNGTEVGTFAFEGIVPRTITLNVDPTLLVDGVNTVRITGNGASHSIVWVDAVATRYTRSLDDVGSSVAFSADGAGAILLEGLSGDSVRVLDVSNPRSPVLLDGLTLAGDSVRLGAEAGARYVAVGSDGVRVPRLRVDHASDLRNAAGAEYLVIAPRALFSGANALVDYRSAQGLTTALVDLSDVFDEFAHGTPDPHAIRAFLQHASENWATPPRYVVLAGEGTFDYLNIRGLNGNLLPALMVNTPGGLFASDTAFADLDDDGRPDLLLGRLPVTNNDALQAFVARLADYEAGLDEQTDRTLLLADGSNSAFNTSTDALATLVNALSDAGLVEQLYRSDLTLDLARTRLFEALEEGVFWVNYTGHGALNAISGDGLLTATDVPTLTSAELAIFTTMTCSTSRFEVPGFESFGETLSNSNLAIGVWGATGVSADSLAQPMLQGFARGIYGDARTLGEAIDGAYDTLATEHPTGARDMLAVYHLLGDPATRLKDRSPADIIIPVEDMGTPNPTGDAGTMMGDAGATVDLGTGEPPTPPSGGGTSGCSAGSQSSNGSALFGLVLALVGLRVRRRQR